MLGNFHAFIVVCRLFSKATFLTKYFRNTIRMLNGLDPVYKRRSIIYDLCPTVCKGFQQLLSVDYSKLTFSKNSFRNTISLDKKFGPRSGPTFCQHSVGSDRGPNCLQRLSAVFMFLLSSADFFQN